MAWRVRGGWGRSEQPKGPAGPGGEGAWRAAKRQGAGLSGRWRSAGPRGPRASSLRTHSPFLPFHTDSSVGALSSLASAVHCFAGSGPERLPSCPGCAEALHRILSVWFINDSGGRLMSNAVKDTSLLSRSWCPRRLAATHAPQWGLEVGPVGGEDSEPGPPPGWVLWLRSPVASPDSVAGETQHQGMKDQPCHGRCCHKKGYGEGVWVEN